MPSRDCSVCGRLVSVGTDKWKYISYSGLFPCSPACVLKWITSQETMPYPAWGERATALRSPRESTFPQFKSGFEQKVAFWLGEHGLKWMYEGFGFEVGDTKAYVPDFLVLDHFVFLETKGQWGCGAKRKMEMFKEQYPEVPLMVVPWILERQFNVVPFERRVA